MLQEVNRECEQTMFADDFVPSLRDYHAYENISNGYIEDRQSLVFYCDCQIAALMANIVVDYDEVSRLKRVSRAANDILSGIFWADIEELKFWREM